MPIQVGFLWIGILGVFVYQVLSFQQSRISRIEETLSKRP